MVVVLIENGATVDARDVGQSAPLHLAVDRDNVKSVQVLLKHKANANRRDKYGRTALHLTKSAAVGRLLLSNGAHVDSSDQQCSTTLHYCSINGNEELALLLIAQGADSNAMNLQGQTPLHMATCHNLVTIVSILLTSKADSNVQNACGQTPLHLARSGEIVKRLLNAGAIFEIKNDFGETALDSAQSEDVAEILLDHLVRFYSLEHLISATSSSQLFQRFGESILRCIKLKIVGLQANRTNRRVELYLDLKTRSTSSCPDVERKWIV